MTAQEKIQKVTEISQSKGWSISVDDKNKSNIQFDFQRYTNYGQDFNFSAEMKCEDIDTLIADMEQYLIYFFYPTFFQPFSLGYFRYFLYLFLSGHSFEFIVGRLHTVLPIALIRYLKVILLQLVWPFGGHRAWLSGCPARAIAKFCD